MQRNFTEEVIQELARALKLHGHIYHDNQSLMTLLTEEVGEVAKAINQGDTDNMLTELVQVAMLCEFWFNNIDTILETEQQYLKIIEAQQHLTEINCNDEKSEI